MSFRSRENLWSLTVLSQVVAVTCWLGNQLGAGVGVVVHDALDFLYCHAVSSIRQRWQEIMRKSSDSETSPLTSFEFVLEVV